MCLLIKDLVQTLDDQRGSSVEYRSLIRELWSLDRSLLQIDLLCRTEIESKAVLAICQTARETVSHCQVVLKDLAKRIQKYDHYRKENASKHVFVDVAMKIRWQISEKEAICKFRHAIASHANALNMLLVTANVEEDIAQFLLIYT